MSATILVERLELSNTPPAVSFIAKATGFIEAGMLISIPMNNGFAMTCEIGSVHQADQSIVLVISADDLEEATFLASFNPVNEMLNVSYP